MVISLPAAALIAGLIIWFATHFNGHTTIGIILTIIGSVLLLFGGGNYYRNRL